VRISQIVQPRRPPRPPDRDHQVVDSRDGFGVHVPQAIEKLRRPTRLLFHRALQGLNDEPIAADAEGLRAAVNGIQQRSRDVYSRRNEYTRRNSTEDQPGGAHPLNRSCLAGTRGPRRGAACWCSGAAMGLNGSARCAPAGVHLRQGYGGTSPKLEERRRARPAPPASPLPMTDSADPRDVVRGTVESGPSLRVAADGAAPPAAQAPLPSTWLLAPRTGGAVRGQDPKRNARFKRNFPL
jgi:hypothetical protein